MQSKYFFSAGEVSGDIYGAELLSALQIQAGSSAHKITAYGLGGPCLQAAGLKILADVRGHSAVGLSENMASLAYFSAVLRRLRSWLREVRPKAMVLIDFQGLNLQLAKLGSELNIPVFYLMAPQNWLWGFKAGVERIRNHVTCIFSVFPQEADFYRKAGVPVFEIGHPLLDMLPKMTRIEARKKLAISQSARVFCWMPGSRRHEIIRLSPVLKKLRDKMPGDVHLQPQAASFLPQPNSGVRLISLQERYWALLAADLVIGASGNMVLESALLGRPVIALYQVSALTYTAAKHLYKRPWITLPNILLNRAVVPEFIQDLAIEAIYAAALNEIDQRNKWHAIQTELNCLLGSKGAMNRAAEWLLQPSKFIKERFE